MPRILNKKDYYEFNIDSQKIEYMPPINSIYVGRPTKWGNPFVIGKDGTREEVVEKYREYISYRAPEVIEELKGKDLICHCAPKACHAYVLSEIANQ